MKTLKILFKIWDFLSRSAYVIVEIDEAIEQVKAFWHWLRGDDENEPDDKGKSR